MYMQVVSITIHQKKRVPEKDHHHHPIITGVVYSIFHKGDKYIRSFLTSPDHIKKSQTILNDR